MDQCFADGEEKEHQISELQREQQMMLKEQSDAIKDLEVQRFECEQRYENMIEKLSIDSIISNEKMNIQIERLAAALKAAEDERDNVSNSGKELKRAIMSIQGAFQGLKLQNEENIKILEQRNDELKENRIQAERLEEERDQLKGYLDEMRSDVDKLLQKERELTDAAREMKVSFAQLNPRYVEYIRFINCTQFPH